MAGKFKFLFVEIEFILSSLIQIKIFLLLVFEDEIRYNTTKLHKTEKWVNILQGFTTELKMVVINSTLKMLLLISCNEKYYQ